MIAALQPMNSSFSATALPDGLDGSLPRKSERQTFTVQKFFGKEDPLMPSGLLGPVVIKTTRQIKLEVKP